MNVFSKPSLSISEHLDQWQARGLSIPDPSRAERYLSVISYYRLSAYTLPFQCGNPAGHQFKLGCAFEDILRMYVFDRQLRLLILDAIERIEVALRTRMTNILAAHHGPHAYLDPGIFDTRYEHNWLLDQVKRKCEDSQAESFIKHYRAKYSDPPLPPIWMVMEILTFKEVSVLFSRLRIKEDKQEISAFWDLPDTVLHSWFRALSDLRNVCAHHSRTWNREFGSRPLLPRRLPVRWPDLNRPLTDPNIDPSRRLYYQLVVIETLLRKINPGSTWHQRLKTLIESHPEVSLAHMGIPNDWADDHFWQFG